MTKKTSKALRIFEPLKALKKEASNTQKDQGNSKQEKNTKETRTPKKESASTFLLSFGGILRGPGEARGGAPGTVGTFENPKVAS